MGDCRSRQQRSDLFRGHVACALFALLLAPIPATAQIIETPPGFLGDPDGLQWNHGVAYNARDREYLIVYPGATDGEALRLDPCGNVIGDPISYFTPSAGTRVNIVAVAYNPNRNEYLAAARHDEPSIITLRYLDAAGNPLSDPFDVAAPGGAPTIHYIPTSGDYVVRWDVGYRDTWLRGVDGDSAADQPILGDPIQVAGDGFSTQAAYGSGSDQSLFVFTVDGPPPDRADIYGRFIGPTGQPNGPRFPLVTGFENQQMPMVVYVESVDRWLVTWEEWKDVSSGHSADVGALFVDAAGEVLQRFSLVQTLEDGWDVPGPMAYDPITDRVWATWFYGTATRLREVAPDDGSLGPERVIANDMAAPTAIATRAHPLNPQLLITWRSGYNGVYAGIVDLAGHCTDVYDDAQVVSVALPPALDCGSTAGGEVVLRNRSDRSWTRADGYALAAVDGSDPFAPEGRVELAADAAVPPGDSQRFELLLSAPDEPGDYVSDWQMAHSVRGPFGEVAEQVIRVDCPLVTPDGETDAGLADADGRADDAGAEPGTDLIAAPDAAEATTTEPESTDTTGLAGGPDDGAAELEAGCGCAATGVPGAGCRWPVLLLGWWISRRRPPPGR